MKKIICITGADGSGKTTKARELAAAWGCPHVETSEELILILSLRTNTSCAKISANKPAYRKKLVSLANTILFDGRLWYANSVQHCLCEGNTIIVSGIRRKLEFWMLGSRFPDADIVEVCMGDDPILKAVTAASVLDNKGISDGCGIKISGGAK